MKTSTGFTFAVGIGFITNVLSSFLESFPFFLEEIFFLGDFLSDDLKLPLLGSFTIQDGGTMILHWEPVKIHLVVFKMYAGGKIKWIRYYLHGNAVHVYVRERSEMQMYKKS